MSDIKIPLAGVIGCPVAHSKSPQLQRHWLNTHGIAGHYIPMHGGYHAHPPRDSLYNIRGEMCLHLEAMGANNYSVL